MLNRCKILSVYEKHKNYQLFKKKERNKSGDKDLLQTKSSIELGQMELPWSDATKPPEGVAMVPVSQNPKMTRGIMPAKWHCYGSGLTDVYTRFYSCRLCWASKRRS